MSTVSKLYDDLFFLNRKANDEEVYPIHKKLTYESSKVGNLYEYILHEVNIPEGAKILDCGCGVGFGSMLLAKTKPQTSVLGISISEDEIKQANKILKNKSTISNCAFQLMSFDELPANSFDLIIAIESLKHSPNFAISMEKVSAALKTDGQLIIIEDIAKAKMDGFIEQRLKKDWVLPELLTMKDYNQLNVALVKEVELTDRVELPGFIASWSKVVVAEVSTLLLFLFPKWKRGIKILRGGFYQELLYKLGRMKYSMLMYSKTTSH